MLKTVVKTETEGYDRDEIAARYMVEHNEANVYN